MKNLDQIRAKNAIKYKDEKFKGAKDGNAIVKKIPTMIMNNGILAAAAFAVESEGDYIKVFEAVIAHLKDIGQLPAEVQNTIKFIDYLAGENSVKLREITVETMSFLNYLRRFA